MEPITTSTKTDPGKFNSKGNKGNTKNWIMMIVHW